MVECPLCGKEMEKDDEEDEILFCFECGFTNDSPSYYLAKAQKEINDREWNKE